MKALLTQELCLHNTKPVKWINQAIVKKRSHGQMEQHQQEEYNIEHKQITLIGITSFMLWERSNQHRQVACGRQEISSEDYLAQLQLRAMRG